MITDHFIITEPVYFKVGDDLALRYSGEQPGSAIVGIDIVHDDGSRTPLPGRMLERPPLDERTKMPISLSGVQFWKGW